MRLKHNYWATPCTACLVEELEREPLTAEEVLGTPEEQERETQKVLAELREAEERLPQEIHKLWKDTVEFLDEALSRRCERHG